MPGATYGQGMELEVLKALGDETRFAMYRELAQSTTPLSAQDLADALGLHANTVRLHLERLREAGVVDVEAVHRGTVGRPQHYYSLAPGRSRPRLRSARARPARRAPRGDGRADRCGLGPMPSGPATPGVSRPASAPRAAPASTRSRPSSPGSGFQPAADEGLDDNGQARIDFLHCPFRELAEAYPELVCNLHRGLCEGVVDQAGSGSVVGFSTLYEPDPCHVVVSVQ